MKQKTNCVRAAQIREYVGFEPLFSAITALKDEAIRQDCLIFVLCTDEKLLAQNCEAPQSERFLRKTRQRTRESCRIPSFDNAVLHEKIRFAAA